MRRTEITELKDGSYMELNLLSSNPREIYLTVNDNKGNECRLTISRDKLINVADDMLDMAGEMED